MPCATCPTCGRPQYDSGQLAAARAFLEPQELNRIPTRDLLDEAEWRIRSHKELLALPNASPNLLAWERERLQKLQGEIQRRIQLHEAIEEGHILGRFVDLDAVRSAIKERVDIREIVENFGWVPAGPGHGTRYPYRCSWHGDGQDCQPSGICFVDEGRFWCFGCNKGGDAIEAVMVRLNLGFGDALRWLARRYYIPIPTKLSPRTAPPTPPGRPRRITEAFDH